MRPFKLIPLAITAIVLMGWTEMLAQQLQATSWHYSTEDGLCSDAISYLAQDDYGYIWIATWNGLARFDGYHFQNYKTGAASHIPNLHNRILSLSIDSQQNVWMRMYDNRVFVLKRSIDQIVNPFEGISGNEEYRTNCPVTIASNGDVMVSIEGVGIYRLRPDHENYNTQLITTSGLTITCMAEGYQGDIWLGTNQGVHRLDPSNMTVERKGQFVDKHVTCIFSNGYNIFAGTSTGEILTFAYGSEPETLRAGGDSPINVLFVDSYGTIWFSDKRQGASCLDPTTHNEKSYVQHVAVPDYDGAGGYFFESNGVLWARLNHGGYGYYNREADEIAYFHNDPSNPWNLINTVYASLELDEGVVFESTGRRGLEKLEIMKKTISRTLLVPGASSNLENETRALYYDDVRRLLLVGNKASSVFFYNDDGELVNTITHDDNGHTLGRIYGISKDARGNYWLASKDCGLFFVTPKAGSYSVVNYSHKDDDPTTLSSNSAYATVEDKQGNIWVATYGGGVNVLTRDKQGQRVFLNPKNGMVGYPYRSHLKVRTIASHKDGSIWAGTTDGILIMSCKNGVVNIQKLEESEEFPDSILQSNDIVCLKSDRKGNMWVGTNGGGIARTEGKDAAGRWLFATYGVKDGLPGEEIRSITFDKKNNAWFTTGNIICSFDTEKHILTTFSSLDGVDDKMCSEGGAITKSDDNILIGTVEGFYTVDKRKLINANASALRLRITDFFVNGELQSPRFNDHFELYVPDQRKITMRSHSANIAFRFAALNYQLQHRVHYQYMLQGYDAGWRNADKSRTASYTSLPTGTYSFKVRAFLQESPERADMKEILIIVPPYWFMSRGAVWLYMLLAATFGIWFMFWRQKKVRMAYLGETPKDGGQRQSAFSAFQRKKLNKQYTAVGTDEYEVI